MVGLLVVLCVSKDDSDSLGGLLPARPRRRTWGIFPVFLHGRGRGLPIRVVDGRGRGEVRRDFAITLSFLAADGAIVANVT
jgi:hypothetical protein